jgi:hypothetical protein
MNPDKSLPDPSNRLLKKASCLFQNSTTKKCDFYLSHKINDLTVIDFAGTSVFRQLAVEIHRISTAS